MDGGDGDGFLGCMGEDALGALGEGPGVKEVVVWEEGLEQMKGLTKAGKDGEGGELPVAEAGLVERGKGEAFDVADGAKEGGSQRGQG